MPRGHVLNLIPSLFIFWYFAGRWRLTATNPIGSAEVGLHFHVRSDPDPPREAPEVEEISPEGIVTLSWLANAENSEIYGDIQYQVEYNRETWDIWLKVSRDVTLKSRSMVIWYISVR